MITTQIRRSSINPIMIYWSYGLSESSKCVEIKTNELRNDFLNNTSFGEQIGVILERLSTLKEERSVPDWDGYGAEPISEESFHNAVDFALSLPFGINLPDICVVPTGEIVFEWFVNSRKVFSVLLDGRNKLSYAGLFGTDTTYGEEYFDKKVSENIINNIHKVFSKDN